MDILSLVNQTFKLPEGNQMFHIKLTEGRVQSQPNNFIS